MKFYIKEDCGDRYLGENGVFLPTKEGANIYESKDVYKVMSDLSAPVSAYPVNYLDPSDVSLSDLSTLYPEDSKCLIYYPLSGAFYREPCGGVTQNPESAHKYDLKGVENFSGSGMWFIPCHDPVEELFIYSERFKGFLKLDPSSPIVQESELIGREGISIVL
ncbi:hypothetical protein Calle1_68 [Cellulophaga phage Calle_1]|uniref:Uncharacterized protein n=1 Tax=Cellulophaga phage Calle_1 TaxID=2745643 RepID=A0A8E4ZKV6_9CAUD|nr:hypothetical protein M1M22_gp047 [Cellulophaga phage Calle_1]QQV89747.1 hypothetical protein Calle1_68 [Cellulophaga phage Calle_1]QQV89842.1 hypothetical protein Calle2_68 [Cellulophaga phage Calle_2]QQV89877.1 hypothetical protein Calle3_68 [Cellulophaga phage Calle_3]